MHERMQERMSKRIQENAEENTGKNTGECRAKAHLAANSLIEFSISGSRRSSALSEIIRGAACLLKRILSSATSNFAHYAEICQFASVSGCTYTFRYTHSGPDTSRDTFRKYIQTHIPIHIHTHIHRPFVSMEPGGSNRRPPL